MHSQKSEKKKGMPSHSNGSLGNCKGAHVDTGKHREALEVLPKFHPKGSRDQCPCTDHLERASERSERRTVRTRSMGREMSRHTRITHCSCMKCRLGTPDIFDKKGTTTELADIDIDGYKSDSFVEQCRNSFCTFQKHAGNKQRDDCIISKQVQEGIAHSSERRVRRPNRYCANGNCNSLPSVESRKNFKGNSVKHGRKCEVNCSSGVRTPRKHSGNGKGHSSKESSESGKKCIGSIPQDVIKRWEDGVKEEDRRASANEDATLGKKKGSLQLKLKKLTSRRRKYWAQIEQRSKRLGNCDTQNRKCEGCATLKKDIANIYGKSTQIAEEINDCKREMRALYPRTVHKASKMNILRKINR